jgi:hypothetical protein
MRMSVSVGAAREWREKLTNSMLRRGFLTLRESRSSVIAHPRCVHLPVPFSAANIGHLDKRHREKRADPLTFARDIFRAYRSRGFPQEL